MYALSSSKNRNLFLVLALALLSIYWLIRFWGPAPSEWEELVHVMNHEMHQQLAMKASFKWSDVELVFLNGTNLTQVPSGETAPLPRIQYDFKRESRTAAAVREYRRQEVRQLFLSDWEMYKRFAWMKDALKPMTGGAVDQFAGWSATLVDTLDTLWIMGLRDEFEAAIDAVAKIDFGLSSSYQINTFETNIRYLGGLLSAYDLSGRKVLLKQAIALGDLLYGAFNTENNMPVDFINWKQAQTGQGLNVEARVVAASPGTLSLEMTRLSQVTGDPKYYDAVSKVMDVFYQGQNKTKVPGLWPTFVSMRDQDVVTGNEFSLAGNADSLYEYLPKMVALLEGRDWTYESMSKGFLQAAKEQILFRPMIPGNEDILISGMLAVNPMNKENDGVTLVPESEHLACYIGGVFGVSGKIFGIDEYVETGEKLAKGCVYGYQSFPTGMMPERYNMIPCNDSSCQWDETVWTTESKKQREFKPHLPRGFTTAKDPRYILRPEAIESVFVMYRITGDPKYQDYAWEMFQSVADGTRTTLAHASVRDVTIPPWDIEHEDYMESFWLAETLKYFYLVFSPPDVISLDDYVLNTEAHPFLRPR